MLVLELKVLVLVSSLDTRLKIYQFCQIEQRGKSYYILCSIVLED